MSLINQVIDKVYECFEKYQIEDTPIILFSKRGKVAGTANFGKWTLNFNKVLMEENPETFINQTVPHECAHLIARLLNKNIKPHGREWQNVIITLGGNPKRCHSYDTSNSAVYHKTKYLYKCDCQNHVVGPTVHKKMNDGIKYNCRGCKSVLIFEKKCGRVSVNDAIKSL